jgi:hypothetical protein
MTIPLKQLGLQEKWPGLAALQDEIADLTRQLSKAEAQVNQHRAEVEAARASDLDAEAAAVRSGKAAPKPIEPQAQKKLEAAERERDVLRRAVEGAQTDLGALRQKYQGELYDDVVAARQEIARSLAGHAANALAYFSRWSDMHYTVKALTPAPAAPDENRPAERLTIVPTAQVVTSPGPDRGRVEALLRYLVSLAPKEEEAEDAA